MTGEQVKAIIQMVATLAVTIAGMFGASLSDSTVTLIAVAVAVVAVVAYAVWKNANFTQEAGLGQGVIQALKNGDISEDAIKVILGEVEEGLGVDGKQKEETENDSQ